MCSSAVSPGPTQVAAEMFTPASLIAAATSARAPGVLSMSMTRSTAIAGHSAYPAAALGRPHPNRVTPHAPPGMTMSATELRRIFHEQRAGHIAGDGRVLRRRGRGRGGL